MIRKGSRKEQELEDGDSWSPLEVTGGAPACLGGTRQPIEGGKREGSRILQDSPVPRRMPERVKNPFMVPSDPGP